MVSEHQASIFDEPTPDVHARMGDPRSSHRTVNSLGRDGVLKRQIWFVFDWMLTRGTPEVNDTQLTELLEQIHRRRYQRNVVARARGLMEDDGFLLGVGERDYCGRMIEHYIINPDWRTPPVTTSQES